MMKPRTTLLLFIGFLFTSLVMPSTASAQQTITCESNNGHRKYCGDANPGQVSLQRQISGASCVQGDSWGVDNQGLWVDRGCRGIFLLGGRNYDADNGNTLTCESNDGGRQYCGRVNPNRVSFQRQISRASCVQGESWGIDRQGLWVDRGCRAVFSVGRWNNNGSDYGGDNGSVTCESNHGDRQYCGYFDRNQVSLQRQISGSPCIQGQTWGVDNQGLWVDRGCRAVFSTADFGNGNDGPDYVGGESISDYPRVAADTSGRGTFSSRNLGSSEVTRGWVDTRSERISVSLTGPNNFKVTFYGDVVDAGDRRIVLRITSSNRGRAGGQAEILLNNDKNEVESITINGNRFSGSFSR